MVYEDDVQFEAPGVGPQKYGVTALGSVGTVGITLIAGVGQFMEIKKLPVGVGYRYPQTE